VIEYSCALLDEIRLLAVDGLHRLSRGGLEIGGILYGTRVAGLLTIEAQRPIECEHAHGPSFKLSENDLSGLEHILASAPAAAAGLMPLGWYHSHTRTGVLLSEEDLKLYNRFFPQPWQVALVLHPEKFGPVTAGFFFRASDGSIRAESSYQEFEVLPAKGRAVAAPAAHRASTPVAVAAAVVVTAAAPAAPPPVPPAVQPKKPVPMPGKTPGRASDPPQPQPLRIMAAAEDHAPADTEKLGAFLKRLEPRRSRRTRWIIGAFLCVAAFFLGLTSRPFWLSSQAPQALSLRAYDQGGQLRVEWDRAAAPVREARGGGLEIIDGGTKTEIPLDREHLDSGGINYARRTADVDVRLKVIGPGGDSVQEVTRFVGPPPAPSPGGGTR
jgi:proteasome lid subunit RPN8/RPN11